MPTSLDRAEDLQWNIPRDRRTTGNINLRGYKVPDSHSRGVALGTPPPSVNFCSLRLRCGFDRTRADGGAVEDRCGRVDRGCPDCWSELLESWLLGFHVQICCVKFLGYPTWRGAGDSLPVWSPALFGPGRLPPFRGARESGGLHLSRACGRCPSGLGAPKFSQGFVRRRGGAQV